MLANLYDDKQKKKKKKSYMHHTETIVFVAYLNYDFTEKDNSMFSREPDDFDLLMQCVYIATTSPYN